MCAIAGCVALAGPPPDCRALLHRMRHRGPDACAQLVRGPVAIGTARLAIVAPGDGAQPMEDAASGIAVAFNGEIFNAPELRRALAAEGHPCRGPSDTEIVLRAFAAWGDRAAARLSGMFGIAVRYPDRLVLLRDRHGIKPLAFHFDDADQRFLFASEAGALAREAASLRLDLRSLGDFAVMAVPSGGATFFEGIGELRPGHMLTIRCRDRMEIGRQRPYEEAGLAHEADPLPEAAADAQFASVLTDAVERHLAADVEIVACLSGGLDSAVLAALAAERLVSPLRTFTVAESPDHPDAVAAADLAHRIGARHEFIVVSFDEFLGAIPATLAAVEMPDLAAGPLFTLLCRRIGMTARCCLNGEGADELLAGYARHRNPERAIEGMSAALTRVRRTGLVPRDAVVERVALLRAAVSRDDALRALLDHDRTEPLARGHLQPVDRLSMAASVEMRVPYLDDRLVALVRSLPLPQVTGPRDGNGKAVLRRLARQRFRGQLEDIAERPKLMMPDAARGHLARFRSLCRRTLADVPPRDAVDALFADPVDRVLLETFRRVAIEGDRSATVTDVLAALSARRVAEAAAE
jgi:asparagine synthase (glutamine-hydrolysing)